MTLNLHEKDGAITLECTVTTRASKSMIKGVRNGMLAVSLKSPPVDGRANEELIKIIADTLSVTKSSITILKGQTSRQKVLRIENVSKEYVNAQLAD